MTPQHRARTIVGLALLAAHAVFAIPLGTSVRAAFILWLALRLGVEYAGPRVTAYQPADRFWTFQLIEAGLYLAITAAALAATIWLLRRRVVG
jgi:hypothetical protein